MLLEASTDAQGIAAAFGTAFCWAMTPLFFGAAAKVDPIVQAVEDGPHGMDVVLDASELMVLDTTGLDALAQILKAVAARGGRLRVVNLQEQPRSLIERSGFAARLAAQGLSDVPI